MRLQSLCSVLAISLFLNGTAVHAEETSPSPAPDCRPAVEVVWEANAYYSNVGLFIPLTVQPILNIGEQSEFTIYRHLLATSWPPRFALVEASINPMPLLGVYLKKNHRSFYDDTEFLDVNLIESVTAGFQEPYSLTLFFGNVATFVSDAGERKSTNKGYMGYMFSFSTQHIRKNELIEDKTLEMEWKLKGDRVFENFRHHWSFRLGTALHSNPDVADAFYFGLRRSLLDFQGPYLSWLNNSNINLRSDFALKDGRSLRHEVTAGKKYPLKNARVALTFDFGFVVESADRYGEALRMGDEGEGNEFTLILRPNLEF